MKRSLGPRLRGPFAALATLVILLLNAPAASAHPLGNFTINHYSRIVIGADEISVRFVLDMAEIPAFSEQRAMDADGDGSPSAAEQENWLAAHVSALTEGLALTLDGNPISLAVADTDLSFPPGQANLPTLRLVVDLRAAIPAAVSPDAVDATYVDATYEQRIGWREIIVNAEAGATLLESDAPSAGASDELTRYPAGSAEHPLDRRAATFSFVRQGSSTPIGWAGPTQATVGRGTLTADPFAGLVGGPLTPLGALLALAISLGLGAAHAASPGHGKTLVAAYLIGSRGTLRQAIWLGLTVAFTHTAGVLVLAGVTLAASQALVPERALGWLSLLAGLLVIGLGGRLLWREARARRIGCTDNGHDHSENHSHGRGGHGHPHGTEVQPHMPDPSARGISARSLAALGLVGGMVPSASALLVLLVAITVDRLLFGLVLIVAFGLGMAVVLAGISASVVLVQGRLGGHWSRWLPLRARRPISLALPFVSALVVLGAGALMSLQAVALLG